MDFPVVVVGKDRTRMTCEVVRHLNEKLKNRDLKFFVVSDRSRKGHIEAIRGFFQRELPDVDFEVVETSPEHFGWGAAMNIGLEKAFRISNSAILVDNDWILQRTILCDVLEDVFIKTPMGCVSFKHLPKFHDCEIQEREFSGFKFDVKTEAHSGVFQKGRPNYVVEIGCMAISKNFFQTVGKFLENVNNTDEVEFDFIRRYTNIPKADRERQNILFGNPVEFRHSILNGPGHIFTHIGLESQSGRKQKWEIPARYFDLNDSQKDIDFCNVAVSQFGGQRVLFATNGDFPAESPLRISLERLCGISECGVYVAKSEKYGKDAFLDIFKRAILGGFDFIIYSDADNFIVSKKNLETSFRHFVDSGYIFAGAPDGGVFCHRKCNRYVVNPFLLYANVGLLKKYFKDGKFDFGNIAGRFSPTSQNQDVLDSYANWRKRTGYFNPFSKKLLGKPEDQEEDFHYSFGGNEWGFDCSRIKESYYEIFLPVLVNGEKIFYLYGSDYQGSLDDSGISSAIHSFENIQVGERDYGSEENLICIHSWFSRCVMIPAQTKFSHFHKERIKKIAKGLGWEEAVTMTSDYRIDWKKYFDRIYIFHHLPQSDRLPRLTKELNRVGILASGISEWRYTSYSRYDKTVFDHAENKGKIIRPEYVNHILEVQRVLNEAKAFGYSRIMIIENDIAFLKDQKTLEEIFKNIPPDYGCCQLDKAVDPSKLFLFNEIIYKHRINSCFADSKIYHFPFGTCNIFSKAGIEECLNVIDMKLCSYDRMFERIQRGPAIAIRSAAIQVIFDNCINLKTDRVDYLHKVYTSHGIDYADYAVPEGYGVGSFIKNGVVMNPRTPALDVSVEANSIGEKCKGRKKVSVYAIAYNESKNIEKWMSCVSEADEVVVLDTGSTDDTVEKLRRLGARVEVEKFDKWNSVEEYDAIVARGGNPWRFDKARNDSMKLVADDSEILVTIDIDEFMQPGWRKKLEDQWIAADESGKHPTCAAYKYVWCYNPDGTEARSFEIHKIHGKGVCHWTHMIHEVLKYDAGERPVWLNDFVVEHHQDMTKTRKSYLPMLAVEAREMPENDRSAHYYGRELMYESRWDEAIAELKRHLSLRSACWRAERAASMRYIANCYSGKKDFEMEELWLWKAALEDKNHREASFRLGEMYMSRKDYKSAERAWEFCLNIKERSMEYISDNRCWSAVPYVMYSQALWWNGCWRAAVNAAKVAVELEPENKKAANQLNGMEETCKKYNR